MSYKHSATAVAFLSLATVMSSASIASAQTLQKRATASGGGRPGQGRCEVEVVVDGAAQVEIRGDNASLRNLKGAPPQWRRFECTAPMPASPAGFQFRGIDGRGRQQLMQAPQNGGPAVIQIDDPDNGSEGYTFEITWSDQGAVSRDSGPGQPGQMQRNDGGQQGPVARGGNQPYPGQNYPGQSAQSYPNQNYPSQNYPGQNYPQGNGPIGRDDRGGGNRFVTDDAVRACQGYVRQQAARRFGSPDIIFRRTSMDDQPGRNDWVSGFFEARGNGGRVRNFQFSCSVNFDNGVVRSADIRPMAQGQSAFGAEQTGRAIQNCEASVEQRLAHDGFQRIDFGQVSLDDRPGRNDSVTGAATATDRGRPAWFDFSCSVDLQDGGVRSADVNRR
jgi:hypothetical protein